MLQAHITFTDRHLAKKITIDVPETKSVVEHPLPRQIQGCIA